jgi:hypothetical protein
MVSIELEARICPHEYLKKYIVARTDDKYHLPCYCHKFLDGINPLEVFDAVCLSSFGFKYGFCSDSKDGLGWEVKYGKYRAEDHVNSEHARRTKFVEVTSEAKFLDELESAILVAEEKILQKK